ncbi:MULTISPECIES: hypothetical protein [Subtercola]|uniref:Uncharacterized protein n=1 Tax=Subtercola vilae TaxID=2056433 RepID=A0A4T2C9W4_9MICO|nr:MULTISPECIES: hypothetical protein [Subtercola]TIH39298.1 hypothetical protein D4765_04260 [Subtercola vilae]
MTLSEAKRIEAHFANGTLDPDLPGTREIVNEAHRVHVNAMLWGSTRAEPHRRRVRGGIALGIGMVVATVGGFCVPFLASR